MNLTLFDLDQTLLAGDSDYMWGQFLVDMGIVDATRFEQGNNHFYEQYKAGTLDIHAFQRFSLQPLIDNPTQHMHVLRGRFVSERIQPAIARHTPGLIEACRNAGDKMAIITATNRFITAPIAQLLGIDNLIATEPEIVNGRYTGAITGTPCFQIGKIERLRAWRETQPEPFRHTRFYSDSHNDLPLLRHVDHAIAVDPDPQLAAAAKAAGWPVISLRGEAAPSFSA